MCGWVCGCVGVRVCVRVYVCVRARDCVRVCICPRALDEALFQLEIKPLTFARSLKTAAPAEDSRWLSR